MQLNSLWNSYLEALRILQKLQHVMYEKAVSDVTGSTAP